MGSIPCSPCRLAALRDCLAPLSCGGPCCLSLIPWGPYSRAFARPATPPPWRPPTKATSMWLEGVPRQRHTRQLVTIHIINTAPLLPLTARASRQHFVTIFYTGKTPTLAAASTTSLSTSSLPFNYLNRHTSALQPLQQRHIGTALALAGHDHLNSITNTTMSATRTSIRP